MVHPQQTKPDQEGLSPLKPLEIVSMRYLERRLGIPRERLRQIATDPDSYYSPRTDEKPPRPFARKKVKPKPRDLDCPQDPLKDVQKRIQHHLLRDLEMPDYIYGGVKGHSVRDNVAQHQDASLIVTIDIKSWFPSITAQNVYFVWYTVLKCSHEVAALLTSLTTFNGHLPQGAPTSTTLSNLVLYSIDLPIRRAAAALDVIYSSYVDDLTLSGANARQLIPIVTSTLKGAKFKVARSKLEVMGGSKQRVVNGLIAGKPPSIPKQTRERIRAALHRLRIGDIYEDDKESYIATQKGRIAYFKSVNAQQTRSLEVELMRLLGEKN